MSRSLSLSESQRQTQREAVCAARLAAEAANPLSRTPIRNTLSSKACISNTQAAGYCISLELCGVCGGVAYVLITWGVKDMHSLEFF